MIHQNLKWLADIRDTKLLAEVLLKNDIVIHLALGISNDPSFELTQV